MDEPSDPRIDRSRGAVYVAEDRVAAAMDGPFRVVQLDGVRLQLPAAVRFGTLEAMQRYADAVLGHSATTSRYPGRGGLRVVPKRGFRSATYSNGVVHVPIADRRGRWALRDTVLLHEIAHHLAPGDGHGRDFRTALVYLYDTQLGHGPAQLLRRQLEHLEHLPDPDAAAAGQPPDAVRRVAALLAKAESTANTHEAEAYLARAAIVAQRHSIELAVTALGPQPRPQTPTHRMISIGEPRRALNNRLVSLLLAIARAWEVRVEIGPSSTYVLVYGMADDLDQVESVFATAGTVMVTRAAEHVRSGAWRGTTYHSPGDAALRPVTAGVARTAFCLGFTRRLGERLDQAQQRARREAMDAAGAAAATPGDERERRAAGAASESSLGRTVGVDVALRERARAVADYHRAASRARGTWRGSASAAGSALGSTRAGARAADQYGAPSVGGPRRALEGGPARTQSSGAEEGRPARGQSSGAGEGRPARGQ